MSNSNQKQISAIPASNRGFGLVELMISLLISTLILIGIINVFSANQVARRAQEALAEVQNNGRIAMSWLKYDLRMAGNTGQTYTFANITSTTVGAMAPAITNNCFTTATQAFDWALAIKPWADGETTPMVFGVDNVTTTNTDFSGCITAADLQPGTDILSIHYVSADPVPDAALVNGNIYLNSGLSGAIVFQCNADGNTCMANLTDARTDPSGINNYRLISRLYYIRSWANTAGDGIPTLVRANLQPDGVVVQEPLINGVTDMQVAFRVDTDDDGIADRIQTAAQLPLLNSGPGLTASWSKVKSIRVSMLIQSTAFDASRGSTAQTFNVGGTNVSLPGEYMGKLFVTTVATRNPSARIIVY